jgi:hypothetical protein
VKRIVGRKKLSKELEMGEGAVRTMIRRLKKSGLIGSSKFGVSMTDKGDRIWRELASIIPVKVHLPRNELSLGPFNVAVLVKDRSAKVRNGLTQRDAAVKAGARGATIIVFKNGKLEIPGVSADLSEDFPEASGQLTKTMNPKDNDVIIIAGGKTLKEADEGVLAAALTLFTR